MGKSTTARMFSGAGIPVWDADDAVHRLYGERGAAVPLIAEICPDAVLDGFVNRERLKRWIAMDEGALQAIEAVVHPLVAADRRRFLENAKSDIVLVDIPLLFETGSEAQVDSIVVVSASESAQRDRVLSRPGMTETHFNTILAKQMPDREKRLRADYVIETHTLEGARAEVDACLKGIRERLADA